MGDPCARLREQAATALEELNNASEAMAEFSILQPYNSGQAPERLEQYLQEMNTAFERERLAWERYYQINLELLDCIRDAYRE